MSQLSRLRDYFDRGGSLTTLEAINRFDCVRLPARALDLKRSGYPLGGTMEKTRTGKRVMRYWKKRT